MINDNDVIKILSEEIPELNVDRSISGQEQSIYRNIQLLADLVSSQIARRNPVLTNRIFRIAERLFQEGSQVTKIAIDNIFIFSASMHVKALHVPDGVGAEHISQEYHRQLYCSGM